MFRRVILGFSGLAAPLVFIFLVIQNQAHAAEPAPGAAETVGSLPYSNQWVEEKISSIIYLSYSSNELAGQDILFGDYNSNFNSSAFAFPSVDFFSKIVTFGNFESQSVLKDYSVWGRYSLGLAALSSQVSDPLHPGNPGGSSDLFIVNMRLGASLEYDHLSWIKPYLGLELDPYFYRNTSAITGAEKNGIALGMGPVLGVHLPVLLKASLSFLGEIRRTIAISDDNQILGSSFDFTGGLGLTF